MELRPGLHRIQAPLGERFIAMYLLTGPDGALLFDTGVADSVPGTLAPYLRKIGFDPAEVEARSTLAFALAIGRHFIVADHPGYTTRDVVDLAGEVLLRPQR